MRIERINSGNAESCANPGTRCGTSHGARTYAIPLITTMSAKKTVNILFENETPSSLPCSKRWMKYGNNIEADTSEPTDTKIKSGIRNDA